MFDLGCKEVISNRIFVNDFGSLLFKDSVIFGRAIPVCNKPLPKELYILTGMETFAKEPEF